MIREISECALSQTYFIVWKRGRGDPSRPLTTFFKSCGSASRTQKQRQKQKWHNFMRT